MRRPLLEVALLFAAGITLARYVSFSLVPLFLLSGALALCCFFWTKHRPLLLQHFIFCLGILGFTFSTAVISPVDLRILYPNDTPLLLRVRGKLSETPVARVSTGQIRQSSRSLVRMHVCNVQEKEGAPWKAARGEIFTRTPGLLPKDFWNGREVEVTGVLMPPRLAAAPGMFDMRAYLASQGIFHELSVARADDWILIGATGSRPWTDRFLDWSQKVMAKGLAQEDQPLQLEWAMTLGWKTALTEDVTEPFMQSGTMHVFAISGMHVMLITLVLIQVLRVFRLPRAACGLIVIPLLWFYTAATGWQASAVRATLMMSIVVGSWSLNRPVDLINSLFASALLILTFDPKQLFQAGFQLSFMVVLSIGLILPPLRAWRDARLAPDPFLPPDLESNWRKYGLMPVRFISDIFITSVAAWIGSLPLSIYYFHLFTPGSLLANLVVVPLSGFALTANIASLFTNNWLPVATELFNHAGWLFMKLMVDASIGSTFLPGSYWYVSNVLFAKICAVCFIFGLGIYASLYWKKWRLVSISSGSTAALGLALYWWFTPELRIDLLSNRGAQIIFSAEKGRSLLVDSGSSDTFRYLTKPYLRAQGLNALDTFVITHGDAQHVSGTKDLIEEFHPSRMGIPSGSFRSRVYREALQHTNRVKQVSYLNAGNQIGEWVVIHPRPGFKASRADDQSLVLSRWVEGFVILSLGDLGADGQKELEKLNGSLHADIIVCGLPSQDGPLSDSLLDRLKPQLVIVMDSDYPFQEQASPSLQQRLRRQPFQTLFLRQTGGLQMRFRRNACEIIGREGILMILNKRKDHQRAAFSFSINSGTTW